jgi:hypothetical protein
MISSAEIRAELMKRILDFLLVIDKVDEHNIGKNAAAEKPTDYCLDQNYPNPFNRSTTIRFQIPQTGLISIKIYNVLGQQIRVLENKKFSPGSFETLWDGRDELDQDVPNGLYFSVLEANNFRQSKKLLLIQK